MHEIAARHALRSHPLRLAAGHDVAAAATSVCSTSKLLVSHEVWSGTAAGGAGTVLLDSRVSYLGRAQRASLRVQGEGDSQKWQSRARRTSA